MNLEFIGAVKIKNRLFNHGNYIWEIDDKQNKAIIRNIVNREEYKHLIQIDFGLAEGPYSFFFQDKYGVICNESSNEIWIIVGDCYSTNYTPKIIKTFEWSNPSNGILCPDNRFLLFSAPSLSHHPTNIKRSIVLVDLHDSTEKASNEFHIRQNIDELSFKEDYLIINENDLTKDIPKAYGADSIIIENWREKLLPIEGWEKKQSAYYKLGWYHLLCPTYINKLSTFYRNEVIKWIEERYGEKWEKGDQLLSGKGDEGFRVDFPEKK